MTTNALASTVSPGALATSATQVATLGPYSASQVVSTSLLRLVEADINVTTTAPVANVFMRITETNTSTVVATSQGQVYASPGPTFVSLRCVGLYSVPSGSAMNVAYMLEVWANVTGCSIGTGSGIFSVRGVGTGRDL